MKVFLYGLVIVMLTVVLSGLAGFILWPIPIVVFLFFKSENLAKIYGSGFGMGVVEDLVTGFPIGFSSVVLLCFVACLALTNSRFRVDPKIALSLGLVFELVYVLLFNFLSF